MNDISAPLAGGFSEHASDFCPVGAHNEWDRLEEVIVGRADFALHLHVEERRPLLRSDLDAD